MKSSAFLNLCVLFNFILFGFWTATNALRKYIMPYGTRDACHGFVAPVLYNDTDRVVAFPLMSRNFKESKIILFKLYSLLFQLWTKIRVRLDERRPVFSIEYDCHRGFLHKNCFVFMYIIVPESFTHVFFNHPL